MKDDYGFLKHTDFFSNKEIIKTVEKISKNKLKVTTTDENYYVVSLYDMDDHENISNEKFIQDRLDKIGLDPLLIYEEGILPDINKSYKIFEYRKEISLEEFLDKANCENSFRIGESFGKILKNIHQTRITEPVDWEKKFLTKANYLFYIHGLSENIGDSDYILIDYIEANIHLTKNTPINLIYGKINEKNIRVYDENKLDLRAVKEIIYGDGVFDFVDINKLAIKYPDFARGVLEGYFDYNKPTRKFYRLLSLYQAYILLYNKVLKDHEKDHNLEENEIDAIMQMYDNFNQLIPSWAQ
ncbi:kanamycin kinase [Anaerococcus vaginimassiliensis]|uniref:kanamycin kinase n=1 Tax=Anaerococcus vaginimassiliensis TaxID=2042308 RepID=UPI001031AE4F|nr:kanamycin kinase [Anaerococcus vaginimassiliensis]